MAREITIRAAFVSDTLTRLASAYLLHDFGGYFRADGFGGYTFANGRKKEESASVSWHIGTAAKDSERFAMVSAFARVYCGAGEQESIYFLDVDGAAYFVYGIDGRIAPID